MTYINLHNQHEAHEILENQLSSALNKIRANKKGETLFEIAKLTFDKFKKVANVITNPYILNEGLMEQLGILEDITDGLKFMRYPLDSEIFGSALAYLKWQISERRY